MYIQSANQISVQKPLTDEWFEAPVFYGDRRVLASDPDFAPHFPSLASRRMCKLLKRAVLLSRQTLKDASVTMPEGIISGTGLGCIENTEKFLWSIMNNGEQYLQPTFFMQSTHNIISSTIAIDLKCHGYNNTFVHRGASFDNALFDAWLQIRQNRINNALVGGFDELTDDYYVFFGRVGVWDFVRGASHKQNCFASEASVSMFVNKEKTAQSICKITDIELFNHPSAENLNAGLNAMLTRAGLKLQDIDAVMTGINSNPDNDLIYNNIANACFGDRPLLQYRHIFGESFSSSALGVYAAVTCLRKGFIPAFLIKDENSDIKGVKHILVHNHWHNRSHSLILLSSCSA